MLINIQSKSKHSNWNIKAKKKCSTLSSTETFHIPSTFHPKIDVQIREKISNVSSILDEKMGEALFCCLAKNRAIPERSFSYVTQSTFIHHTIINIEKVTKYHCVIKLDSGCHLYTFKNYQTLEYQLDNHSNSFRIAKKMSLS